MGSIVRGISVFTMVVILGATAFSQPSGSSTLKFTGGDKIFNGGLESLTTSTLTVELWVKLQSYGCTIFTKMNGADNGVALEVGDASTVTLSVGYDGGRDIQNLSAPLSLNTWYHLAVTFDNGTATLFVNGDSKGISTGGSSINTINPFCFGSFITSGAYGLKDGSEIDDIRIFNSVRTELEINSDMNSSAAEGALAFWNLNDATGDVVKDISENENDGFLGTVNGSSDANDPEWFISESLIASYDFSGNVNDKSGNGHNGLASGGSFTNDRFKNGENAYFFNGEDDYINLGNSSLFNFTDAMTISLWVKGNSGEPYGSLIRKGQFTWSMIRDNQTDKVNFGADGVSVRLTSTATVFDGSWHYLVGTYDGSSIKLYVDGVLDSESDAEGTIMVNSTDVWVGGNSEDTNFGNFGGLIDDIQLYNYAVDASVVESNYSENNWVLFSATDVYFGYVDGEQNQKLTLHRNDQGNIYYSFSAFSDFGDSQYGRINFNTTPFEYGDNEGDLTADINGNSFQIGSGPHSIHFWPLTSTYEIQSIESIGLVGTATPNGWNGPDINFTYEGNGIYTLNNVVLTDGQFKFRANNDWKTNWGYYPNNPDTLIDSGENIDVTAGTYSFTLNLYTRTYTKTLIYSSANEYYRLGSPNASLNTSEWSLQDEALSKFRGAITDSVNFGTGGTVQKPVIVDLLSSITPAYLSTLNGFFEPYWDDAESSPFTSDIIDAFHNGMDLWLLEDDNSYNNIGETLGLVSSDGSGTPSFGNSPFFNGPFGNAASGSSYGDFNQLDSATVIALGGTIGAMNESGEVTIAYWPKGVFSEGSGALVVFTDVDMITNYFNDPYTEELQPNAILALNTMAWLVGQSPALPVEMSSFTAQSNNNKIYLNWSTVTESNNSGWEVESRIQKSEDRSQSNGWKSIGFITGKGTTTEKQNYTFSVSSLQSPATLVEFRLKQIDMDGKFSYSEILSVDLTPETYSLSQNYPNPFNPTTAISYRLSALSNVKLVVFDLLGREVTTLVNEKKEPGNYSVNFNASNLTSGVYFYKITAGSFTETKKMTLVK